MSITNKTPLIELRKIKKYFPLKRSSIFDRKRLYVRANEDISFTIYKGETFGLVGESGCGKSTLGRVILQLYPPTSGSVLYYGIKLRDLNPRYVLTEIKKLPHYQKQAISAYERSLVVDKKIEKLANELKIIKGEGEKVDTEALIKRLKSKSKEDKKEASRQLRNGSKTAGDLILKKDIGEISRLMYEEEVAHRNRVKIVKNIKGLEKRLENTTSNSNQFSSLLSRIEQLKKEAAIYEKKSLDLKNEIGAYHNTKALPITERTTDPAYQEKMRKNKEAGINLSRLDKEEMRKLRRRLQIIFQDPYSSLDPRMTVGQSIEEAVVEHRLFKKGSPELEAYIIETMAKCGLDHYMIHRYAHQFSGGQRQRLVIARALALKPEFVVCDESVSALDVSIQSQILNLLNDLKKEQDLTYLFISHDLSVIKHVSDRIGVMYLGDVVELAESEELYNNPLHPYTKALLSSIPTTDQNKKHRIILEGDLPSNINPPTGCKFRTRCPLARDYCKENAPAAKEVKPNHYVSCHFYEETKNL